MITGARAIFAKETDPGEQTLLPHKKTNPGQANLIHLHKETNSKTSRPYYLVH